MSVVKMSGPPTAPAASKDSGGETAPHDIERMEVERTDNGGFVVTTFQAPPAKGGEIGDALAFTRPSKHSFSSIDDLVGYMTEAFSPTPTDAPTEPPAEETPAGEAPGPDEAEA
jgi:hypothetical protein